jgi:hypothetical protein
MNVRKLHAEWIKYAKLLSGKEKNVKEVRPDVLSHMSLEQQAKMAKLYEEAKTLRVHMLGEDSQGKP